MSIVINHAYLLYRLATAFTIIILYFRDRGDGGWWRKRWSSTRTSGEFQSDFRGDGPKSRPQRMYNDDRRSSRRTRTRLTISVYYNIIIMYSTDIIGTSPVNSNRILIVTSRHRLCFFSPRHHRAVCIHNEYIMYDGRSS